MTVHVMVGLESSKPITFCTAFLPSDQQDDARIEGGGLATSRLAGTR